MRGHDAVAERPLDEPGLPRRVLVHEAAVHAQRGLLAHGLVLEGPLQDDAGGPLEVGLSLVRHVPAPLLLQLQNPLRLLQGCELLLSTDYHFVKRGSVF